MPYGVGWLRYFPSLPDAAFLSNSSGLGSEGRPGSEPTSTEDANKFGLRFGFPENQLILPSARFNPWLLTCKSTPEAGKLKFFLHPPLPRQLLSPNLRSKQGADETSQGFPPHTPSPLLYDFFKQH